MTARMVECAVEGRTGDVGTDGGRGRKCVDISGGGLLYWCSNIGNGVVLVGGIVSRGEGASKDASMKLV